MSSQKSRNKIIKEWSYSAVDVEFSQTKAPDRAFKSSINMGGPESNLAFNVQPEYLNKTYKKKYRFLQMILCSVFVMGNYFCYDYPASLELQIEKKFNVTTSEYGLLYTGYAAPNLIMPLIGGCLSDKLGKRTTLLIFVVFLCVGQGIFALGGYWLNFNLMVVGRVIYGIGCESMYVGQSVILTEWFINYELQLAMGMSSCVPLLGSFLGGAVVPSAF